MLTRICGKKNALPSGKAERSKQQMEENRVAALSIIVEPGGDVDSLNRILTEYRRYVVGRMGIPYRERGISIMGINTRTNRQGYATMVVTFHVSGKEELSDIVARIRQIPNVIDINRNGT